MFPLNALERTFVEADGVTFLQYATTSEPTRLLTVQDATPLKKYDIRTIGPVKLARYEVERFAEPYARYVREMGEVTKVHQIHFANWLLKDEVLRSVATRRRAQSITDMCAFGKECTLCRGEMKAYMCQANVVAIIHAGDALIGLTMLVGSKEMKLEDQEYFWPTPALLARMCRPARPERHSNTRVLIRRS